jgi:hypothetical protein
MSPEVQRAWNARVRAEGRKIQKARAGAPGKLEKLSRLTTARGATPAEAENAREKAAALTAKVASMRNPYVEPLPETLEELLARRKGKRQPPRRGAKSDHKPRADAVTLPSWSNGQDGRDRHEVAQLRAENTRLKKEIARLKLARSKAGRKPIGDRPMTPAERMARMRASRR